jgi:solute carrier family 35 protein F1/2
MAQQQPHDAEGYFGKGEDVHTGPAVSQTVYPKDAEVTASSGNEHTGAPLQAVGTGNSVLERDAQSKGHSFEYLKTKQFWLTLLLGQGSYFLSLATLNACIYSY